MVVGGLENRPSGILKNKKSNETALSKDLQLFLKQTDEFNEAVNHFAIQFLNQRELDYDLENYEIAMMVQAALAKLSLIIGFLTMQEIGELANVLPANPRNNGYLLNLRVTVLDEIDGLLTQAKEKNDHNLVSGTTAVLNCLPILKRAPSIGSKEVPVLLKAIRDKIKLALTSIAGDPETQVLRELCEEQAGKISILEAKNVEDATQIEELKIENARLTAVAGEIDEDMLAIAEKIAGLQLEVEEKEAQRAAAEHLVQSTSQTFASQNKEVEELKNQIVEAETKMLHEKERGDHLQEQIDQNRGLSKVDNKTMEQNKKEVKEARDKLAHQQMEMVNIRKEREDVEEKLAEAERQIRGMEVAHAENDSKVDAERLQTEQWRAKYEDQAQQNERLQERIKVLEDERVQLMEDAENGRRGAAREAELVVDLESERNKNAELEKDRDLWKSKYEAAQKQIDTLEAQLKEMTERMSMMTTKLVEVTGEDFTASLFESTGFSMSQQIQAPRVNKYMGKRVFQRLYLDAEDRMVRLSQRQAQRRDIMAFELHAQMQSVLFNQKMSVMSFLPNRMQHMPTDDLHAFTHSAIPMDDNRRHSYIDQYTQNHPIKRNTRSLSPGNPQCGVHQNINLPARPCTANDIRRPLVTHEPDLPRRVLLCSSFDFDDDLPSADGQPVSFYRPATAPSAPAADALPRISASIKRTKTPAYASPTRQQVRTAKAESSEMGINTASTLACAQKALESRGRSRSPVEYVPVDNRIGTPTSAAHKLRSPTNSSTSRTAPRNLLPPEHPKSSWTDHVPALTPEVRPPPTLRMRPTEYGSNTGHDNSH